MTIPKGHVLGRYTAADAIRAVMLSEAGRIAEMLMSLLIYLPKRDSNHD